MGRWSGSDSGVRRAALLLALLAAGCTEGTGTRGNVPHTPVAMDPLAAFVASSGPGARGMVVAEDGSRYPARIGRSYVAATGRECREVLLGSGRGERSSLVCQGGPETGGAWVVVRPLLGGGGLRS